jgi:hypothetical protein
MRLRLPLSARATPKPRPDPTGVDQTLGEHCDDYAVLLAYVDESYTTERYFLAAVVVPEASARPLTSALDTLVAKAALAYPGLPTAAELHAHDLVNARRDWAALRPMLRARIGVYNDAIQAVVDHRAQVIVRGVDIPRLRARYPTPAHPHSVVLGHLIERVDEYAAARNELALMIADEIDQQDAHRRDLWSYQRLGTWGYRGHAITRIVDTLHFAPSESSRLLQAADLVAFLYRRVHAHTETDPRAAREWASTWARLFPAVSHSWCWQP